MTEHSETKKVVVIGAGPGGYAAAFMAADLGQQVTIIDPEKNPGGVCLYRGCIPSKALLHIARLLNETAHASDWGVTFAKPKINVKTMREWKNDVVAKLTGGLGQLSGQRKISHIRGTATFLDRTTLEISKVTGGTQKLSYDYAILATGSRPTELPGSNFDAKGLWDSTSALDLPSIPKSLLIVGGGYIGLELGSVYAALGSQVTVVEMTSGLLPGADRDLVRVLQKPLEEKFESILLNTTVKEIKKQKNGYKATFEGKEAGRKTKLYDRVLVSVGRRPNSEDLGLENTGVELDNRGFVKVDDQMRTGEPRIFAIGDVVGEPMLAHKASHEGRVAAEVISGEKVAFEPRAIPAVVFTDPEVAWCGLTETAAKADGIDIRVTKFPWGASGRATTLGRSDGLTKLIFDPQTEQLLGMGIVGPGAGEMIAEGVLAIEMGANARDISMTIHQHPTLSETVMEAADLFFNTATHYYKPKRK